MDESLEKEMLGRCLYEVVNKVLYEELRGRLLKEEQTYSVQPVLIAHPSLIKSKIQAAEDEGTRP